MKPHLTFELKRKATHFFGLLYIVVYLIINKFFNHKIALLSLTFILLILIILEFSRVQLKKKIPLTFLHSLRRDSEKNKLGTEINYALGALVVFSVFDVKIAITALLVTVFGDSASALFGIIFGKRWINKDKAWEGVIAEFVVDFIVSFLVLNNLIIAVVMSLTATSVETFFRHVDDNLTIPVFSGFVGEVLRMMMR